MEEEELAEIIKLSNWPGKAGPIPLTQTILQKQKKMLHGPCQDRFEDGVGSEAALTFSLSSRSVLGALGGPL